jgi:hypothetical protein
MISVSLLPSVDQCADFAPQVHGQFGIGTGERLVLADQAAQFGGDGNQALLGQLVLSPRPGFARVQPVPARASQGEQQDHQPALHFDSSASSGRILPEKTSGVIGPVCFMRMMPALSMT